MKKITCALALPIFYSLFTGSAYALIDCEKDAQLPHPLPWCSSPIIIDTDGKGFHLTSARNGVLFDIAGNGRLVQMAWTAAGSWSGRVALISGFFSLRLWIDKNHDGLAEPDEVFTLPELGVFSASLRYRTSRREDIFGNLFRYKARINLTDPEENESKAGPLAYDVFFESFGGN